MILTPWRPGIGIFAVYNKRIILLLRDNNPKIAWPNTYSFIGGGIEYGEEAWQTALREWREEIRHSKALSRADLVFVGKHHALNRTYYYLELDTAIQGIKEGRSFGYFSLDRMYAQEQAAYKDDSPGIGGTMKTVFMRYPQELHLLLNYGDVGAFNRIPEFQK